MLATHRSYARKKDRKEGVGVERGQSLYLDALRLIAALEVAAFHLGRLPGSGVPEGWWNAFGHEAVVIFFVLSGFVIRHAAGKNDPTLRLFAISRISRVWSVAIPALLLTWLFDSIGHRIDLAPYEGLVTDGSAALRVAIGAAMLNESWVSVQMLSNTPYWSIAYEVFYYALFAAIFYLKGRWRWLILVPALIAGPKILLLFPIWLMGWAAYSERWSARWPRWLVWAAFCQPVLCLLLYSQFGLMGLTGGWLEGWLGHDLWRNGLAWSRYVISDSLLGLSIAVNLIAAKHLGPELAIALNGAAKPIRWLAGRSFTLYLLHQPTMLLMIALSGALLPPIWRTPFIVMGATIVILAVAEVTEGQRHRLRAGLERLWR